MSIAKCNAETGNNTKEFQWTDGNIIGTEGWFDSRAPNLHYNTVKQDCLYHAPCNEAEHWDCQIKSGKGSRWYNDRCDEEALEHLTACQIGKGKQVDCTFFTIPFVSSCCGQVDLTGIFHPKSYCPAGWSLWAGWCYMAGQGEQTWSNARAWCRANTSTSDLATIHSPAENDHIWAVLGGWLAGRLVTNL